jgi:hypothetical protein
MYSKINLEISRTPSQVEKATLRLLKYCRENNWAGYDPYDALNSEIFKCLPFLNFRIFRLALTQMLKRSPLNFRPFLRISGTQNPKAMALFLMAFLKLSKLGLLKQEDLVEIMIEKLIALRSPNTSYWCWGYSFPWQTRTILVPRGAPNLVCTSFVANALLDAYETNPKSQCLNMATSAGKYILDKLYWEEDDLIAGFSYPLPSLRNRVHNANFLGAALLCRLYNFSGDKNFLKPALKVARYSAGKQNESGSWDYGEANAYRWIDNFHSGYNLCALRSIQQSLKSSEFEEQICRGFDFYKNNFFRDDGAPKYFHNRTYPIDIHSVAQSIITLLTFRGLDKNNLIMAHAVFEWAINNMLNRYGHYYYQKLPYYTVKISYMRWSQAWMFLALSWLLEKGDQNVGSM